MGRPVKDLTNERYGNLVVIRRNGTGMSGQAMWFCVCDCGGNHTVLGQALRTGKATRCPACVHAGRGINEQDGTNVDLYYHAHGADGGFVVATDRESGRILAHSRWSTTPIKGDPKRYPSIRGVIQMLIALERIPPRGEAEGFDRWYRRCNLVVNAHAFVPRPQLVERWAEVQASGKGPVMPELDTTARTV